MNYLEAALRQFPNDLNAAGVEWALVGGFAVSAYAGARATADIDVAVAVSGDSDVERIVHALRGSGYSVATLMERTDGDITTVRLEFPGRDDRQLLCDLLVRTSGIEAEIVAAARPRMVLPGLTLPVARLHHLLAMKTVSERDTRLQDRLDIQALLAVATPDDIDGAIAAMKLIESRGAAEDKDLVGRFEELRQMFGP